jgi:hypothetical protein
MSIDLTERSYERPAAGRSRPVPYLRLVHSNDKPRIVNEHEDEGRNISFALVIAAAAAAIIGPLALWLV